jgi:hypothetical protein
MPKKNRKKGSFQSFSGYSGGFFISGNKKAPSPAERRAPF